MSQGGKRVNAIGRILRAAQIIAAPPLVPSVAELLALPVIAQDYLGDLAPNSTALAIAMHAAHYAEIAVGVWEDEHEQSGAIPAATVVALANALDAAAWATIYERQETDDE